MGKVWVLETETKGTGANMVPLDRVLRKPGPAPADAGFSLPKLKPPAPTEPEPRAPHRFRVVDLVTREVLADDADARAAIGALHSARSIVDVNVWVWQPERDRWRMLTMDELRALWTYRGRLGQQPEPLISS